MITDFHSHILPGIDDGSAGVEESIAMLRMEAEQGVTRVVATPHFYARHDTPQRFLERRNQAEALLREEMKRHDGLPELIVGAEVHFFNGMSDSDALKLLTIDRKDCILLEMPEYFWTDAMYREMEQIYLKQGIRPVIAHVDRYISPLRDHGIPERLAQLPVEVQANASFFLRRSTARMALKMLSRNQIHVLGSDCHNLTMRPPNLGKAVQCIQGRFGDQLLQQIRQNEARILDREMM